MQSLGKFFPNDGYVIRGYKYQYPFIDVFWYNRKKSYVLFSSPWMRRKLLKNYVFPLRPGAAAGGGVQGSGPPQPLAERPMRFGQIRDFCWKGEGGR